jgi:hypothetical protein
MDRIKREEKAKDKVKELSDRIDEQVKLLDRELQLRRNLMVLVPSQKSTKDRIITFAETLGKRIKTKRIELQRLECYRDYLESELSWCLSQHQQQQIQSRKLSLPLPTHLYSFTSNNNNNNTTTTTPTSVENDTIKKLSNLVFTTDPSEESPISNNTTSSSTTSSLHGRNILEDSSMTSKDEESPQLPVFAFPSQPFNDNTIIKSATDKVVEMDRIMRRRSQSNPVLPNNNSNRLIVDKKLLLEKPKSGNRTRSGSEASSVKEDDDDMSVIIINDSEELLAESNSWPTTTDI